MLGMSLDIPDWLKFRRGAGGGAPFAPTDISGLSLWLKADDAATVINTGGQVDQWNDKSGNSNNATATLTQRPITGTRTINSKNAIDFDGSVDIMTLPAGVLGISAGANTIFVTYQSDNAGDATQQLITMFNGAAGRRYEVAFTATQIQGCNSNTANTPTTQADTRDTSTKTIGFRRSGTAITTFVDGVQGTPSALGSDLTAVSATLGAQTSGVNRFNGLLAEVVWYNSSLSDTDMDRVGNYLNTEWGGGWTNMGF